MSHESPLARYIGGRPSVFDEINRQVGSDGLNDFDEYREMTPRLGVEFYNPTVFYKPDDVVFWNALNGFRLFPSGFEDVRRQFASGNVIRNLMFSPGIARPDAMEKWKDDATERDDPVVFMEAHAGVQFPTPVVEWMPKPLYGGMTESALHIDTLLTTEPTDLAHPYLELIAEGRVVLDYRMLYMRRFAGISQKEAVRGPEYRRREATA